MKKKSISIFEYLFIFIGFAAISLLEVPTSDIFFFSHDYENSIGSFVSNSLCYGNGRFLGNFLGFAFAHWFTYSFVFVAAVLTLLVFVINKFFFNGNCKTIFPVALLIAFPSSGMFSEVYTSVPSFVNYVVPMVLVFAVLCLIKNCKSLLSLIPIFVLTVASCLFSENNTISIFTLSVLTVIYLFLKNKKANIKSIVFLIGTVAGGIAMVLIPRLTGSAHKLDYYRNTAKTIPDMITMAIASFSTFCEIFSSFVLPIIILSASLIYLIIKTGINKKLQKAVCFYLAFFPLETVFYSTLSDNAPASVYMYLLQTGFVTLYAISIFAGILCLKKSDFKNLLIEIFILMLSSVGPMLFADKYGYRTFYLSYIILLAFSLTVFGKAIKEIPAEAIEKVKSNKFVAPVTALAFACLCAVVFVQSVYNFNFYVARTNYIAEQVVVNAEKIEVPALPCRGISCEDENPSLVGTILYKQDSKSTVAVAESVYCENGADYSGILSGNPISNTISALQNLNYKDGKILDKLRK